MKNLKYFLILIVLFNISCFGLFDNGSDHIVGDFYTVWIDEHSNRTLSIKDTDTSFPTVISEYVFSVGHNDNFIIAKQHPKPDRFAENINVKITNYYIVDINNSDKFVQKIYGPFDEKTFNKKLKELNVGKIEFDLNYPENP